MIPKTLHQLWFSGDNFTKKYWQWRQSWLQFGPDWTLKLYTIEDILRLPMPKEMREVLENPSIHYCLKTDVGRWIPLFAEGGVYADTDVELLKPIYDLLDCESFCGQSRPPDGCGNAVIGSVAGLPLMEDIGLTIAQKILEDIDAANKTIVDAGVRVAGKMLAQCERVYPVEYFYPYSWQSKKNEEQWKYEARKNSYCIHHWTGLDPEGWTRETILREQTTIIKIGIPSYDRTLTDDVIKTKKALSVKRPGVKIIWDESNGLSQYCLHTARNRLLYGSKHWWNNYVPQYDYFFSMDNDNGISFEGLIELVAIAKANNNECIVSAAYPGRHGDTKERLVAGYFIPGTGGHDQIKISDFVSWKPELFPREVDIVGGGAVLIPKKVIMALPAPLWQHESYELPHSTRKENVYLCEDQSLCRAVKKAGFRVLLARVVSTHRGAGIKI